MQPLLIPPALSSGLNAEASSGQKICVIAPSGALREPERFAQGLEIWRERGYKLQVPENIDRNWGYLAGTDSDRLQQFIQAWNDPECAAIITARGGYGCTRLLEKLVWQDLNPNPKWLIGFSDITALLWGLAVNLGIASVHGAVLTTLAAEPDWSTQKLFDWLEGKVQTITLGGTGWGLGKATGVLLAGNLNIATHLIGTSVFPDLDNVILAFEDVAESPYKVDRMLTQWRMLGLLEKVKGIAIGRFSRSEPFPNYPSFSMQEVWRDRLEDLNIPIVVDLPFGHDGTNVPLVIGAEAQLDGDTGLLSYWHTSY
ncbi:putative MccF-like protein (microcin C7 resistance) [Synechococcus sp. PCC 7502]|uniref:S66 peptidase family protein n=1 Tax=Synechococcus sp. PCC 7502 TaxID=1173263 RepID=UPI00029FD2A0|nr:LD-carboxypeptidase [Synechococcus sp. PCC 7502]AFY73443.1 putative MccF-like protein (microcin C7 resistance) [Synechococcus sp. PCC 7502]